MNMTDHEKNKEQLKENPQEVLEKRTCLKIAFMRKLLFTSFLQSALIAIISFCLSYYFIRFPIEVAIVFLVIITIFALLSFFAFKHISKWPVNIIALIVFTICELLLIDSGYAYFYSFEYKYVVLITFSSISAVYLVFLIYSLFIRRRFKTWIPLICVLIILAILFAVIIMYFEGYQTYFILDCVGVIIFSIYVQLRLTYINKKFGNGYSGGAYIVLAAKMITDAFIPILCIVLIAVVILLLIGAICGGGGGNCQSADCRCNGLCGNDVNCCDEVCMTIDCNTSCNCDDCVCCYNNEELFACCCFCYFCQKGRQSRLVYDDLEKFDNIPQSDFDVAPLPLAQVDQV